MRHWTSTSSASALRMMPHLLAAACGDASEDGAPDEGIAQVEQALTNCQPAADECAVFKDANYRGECVNIGMGRYSTAIGSGFLPNESISSWKCGADATFKGCQHSDWKGLCRVADHYPNLDTVIDNLNDKISSIEVFERGTDTGTVPIDKVRVWVNAGPPTSAWSGPNGIVAVLGDGVYNTSADFGVANDSISSFEVGEFAEIYFCRDANLNNSPGHPCVSYGPGVYKNMNGRPVGNDAISSISVRVFPH